MCVYVCEQFACACINCMRVIEKLACENVTCVCVSVFNLSV